MSGLYYNSDGEKAFRVSVVPLSDIQLGYFAVPVSDGAMTEAESLAYSEDAILASITTWDGQLDPNL